MSIKVFISHSAADSAMVLSICASLRAVGVDPYIFEHDPQPGRLVADKVQAEIRLTDAVIVLLTPRSSTSSYVHQEVGFALAASKPVFPLVETGTSTECLAMLQGVEHIELNPLQPTSAMTDLAIALQRLDYEKTMAKLAAQRQAEIRLAVGLIVALLLIAVLAREG